MDQAERVLFTTKATLPWQTFEDCGKGGMLEDLPDDVPAGESVCYIQSFSSKAVEKE